MDNIYCSRVRCKLHPRSIVAYTTLVPATFNNTPLGNVLTRVTGPMKTYRAQQSQVPGVSGARVYDIGDSHRDFIVDGRMMGAAKAILDSAIRQIQSYQTGNLYTFYDDRGTTYQNCLLTDYRPVGPYVPILYGGIYQWTVEIRASIRWMAPT